MTAFTLGVHNLPAAEVVLIKTLLRLFSHDASFQWRFAEAGPFDAVLADATCVAGHPPASLARAVLKITRVNAAMDADSISRPIRAEQLQAWLERQEQRVRALPRLPVIEPRRPAVKGGGGIRFKLRRWPSAALLKNDPQRIRLATLLARRALGARELSSISRLPAEQCQDFVDTLRQADLLEVLEAPTTAASPAAATARPAPPASFAHSLITGIRRRLGL